MSATYYQTFRQSICINANEPPRRDLAFQHIDEAIQSLNEMLQHQLEQHRLYQPEDPEFGREAVVVIDPVITGMEIRFLRDTGRPNGSTGEIMGQQEDRYHAIILDVAFQDP